MVAKFIGEEGTLKGVELELEGAEEWVVGRDPDECQLLVEDPAASRRHLLCRHTSEGFLLENLSETNPVEVNGEPLEDAQTLQNGDTIRIGNALFRFYMEESEIEEMSVNEPATIEENEEEMDESAVHDSILDEDEAAAEEAELAKIDLTSGSRWLLKVVAGPNTGAEFPMENGRQYLIGTDTGKCDVIFQDLSVSRHHAKINTGNGDQLTIEDLDSRNGVMVEGESVEQQFTLEPNKLVTIGTTAFLVCDRESDAITIASPFLIPTETASEDSFEGVEGRHPSAEQAREEEAASMLKSSVGALIFLGIVSALLVVVGIGVVSLFQTEEIVVEKVDHNRLIEEALVGYPQLTFTFEEGSGRLLLLGHILTTSDREQILYNIRALPFVRQVDNNMIVDEFIWQENNLIIGKNPAWQGVTMQAPRPGKFILTGSLQTSTQFDSLMNFININFPYLDRLESQVVVEEQILARITNQLLEAGFTQVTTDYNVGEVTLSGTRGIADEQRLGNIIERIKTIPGVRVVRNFVIGVTTDSRVVDLSDQYEVTGYSNRGDVAVNVVVNGRILARGDLLDGMTITSITPGTIFLERGELKYKIEFNK